MAIPPRTRAGFNAVNIFRFQAHAVFLLNLFRSRFV
jgi:hypothetical protein